MGARRRWPATCATPTRCRADCRRAGCSSDSDRSSRYTVYRHQAGDTRYHYGTLLLILRNNDLAAVSVDDVINIIPASIVRQYPLPVLYEADDSIHDEEWVTWVIHVENATPGSIVPIIRPIMPAAGHFAANPGSRSMLLRPIRQRQADRRHHRAAGRRIPARLVVRSRPALQLGSSAPSRARRYVSFLWVRSGRSRCRGRQPVGVRRPSAPRRTRRGRAEQPDRADECRDVRNDEEKFVLVFV